MDLVNRSRELDLLTGLLARAAEGTSAAVVVRGEPGIGKTALLDALSARAVTMGMPVARVTGVECEAPLGYAALHRLLLPFPGLVERLPARQREALRSTFGLVAGPPPDRFLVALGVLTLLAEAASQTRLLCIVDDAQWLDVESAAILGFVARRVQAEGIVMVFADRELSQEPQFPGLPEIVISGLDDDDAAALLSVTTAGALSPDVVSRLIGEGGGNPLALIELVGELTQAQLAGEVSLPDPLPAAGSLQQMFGRRLGRLSQGARLLLAAAAAEPTASDNILWRVAQRLDVDAGLAAAEMTGLAEFDTAVTFRHPLVRSVAYHSVPAVRRRMIHRILAEVSDASVEPDRVAWHLAMAAAGPDEELATRLSDVAGRAMERGGYAATTAFLARAAELSADPWLHTDHLLAAAEAALTAGRLVQARAMLDQAESAATSDEHRATLLRLAGHVSFATGRTGDAARQLLAAARQLLPADSRLGRRTLLAALIAANYTRGGALEQVRAFAAGVAETPVDLRDPSSAADCLLLGFLHRLSGTPKRSAPLLRAALGHLSDPATPDVNRMSMPVFFSALAAWELFDESATPELVEKYIKSARRAGALTSLPVTLIVLAGSLIYQGRFGEAREACAEGRALSEATGAPGLPFMVSSVELALLCWRGRELEARDRAASITAALDRLEEDARQGFLYPLYYLTVLDLGLGLYREAYDRAHPVMEDDRLGNGTLVLPDFIEAAVRCHELPVAQQALSRLEGRARASGAQWGLGRLACCQALLAGDAAEPLYHQAIDLLEPSGILTDLARTRLLYGEWLRRQRRRRDASVQLGRACDMFTEMGASGFAARARAELRATGERTCKRDREIPQVLTSQEAQIARLVTQGATNREVAAQLFISPATVEYHLRKIYRKLDVTSRTQLASRSGGS